MDRCNIYAKTVMKKTNNTNFKKTLSKFTTGITIIATSKKFNLIGKTINSFSSLSLSPPLILFSLDVKSSKLNIFNKSDSVSINILSNKQKRISENFAKKNPNWEKVKYKISQNGNPLICNCVSNLECTIINKIKKGDHIIFICKVSKVMNNDKLKPLIYYNSKYL